MFESTTFPLKTIGEMCTLKSGTTFDKTEELAYGEIIYIKVSDMNLVGNEKYIVTSKTFVTRATAKNTIIPANSVIFPKRGGAIGTNKKRINTNEICVDLNTMAVTPSRELNIQYLYQYFQLIDMGKLYNGSSVPQINNKDIAPLIIKVPPIGLQNQFAEFVKLIDKSKFVGHSKYFYEKFLRLCRQPWHIPKLCLFLYVLKGVAPAR
jgi:type I restriction enzyme S subunit